MGYSHLSRRRIAWGRSPRSQRSHLEVLDPGGLFGLHPERCRPTTRNVLLRAPSFMPLFYMMICFASASVRALHLSPSSCCQGQVGQQPECLRLRNTGQGVATAWWAVFLPFPLSSSSSCVDTMCIGSHC